MQRKSKQKEGILKVLKGSHSHPTAEGIYEQVKQEIPNISLGTVYRNLRLLKQGGDIVELDLVGTLSRFDGDTQPHYTSDVSNAVVFLMWMSQWIERWITG